MNVLWITNTLFPDICEKLEIATPVTGGWMFSGAKALMNTDSNINLAVASQYIGKNLKIDRINNISYYLLPSYILKGKSEDNLKANWHKVHEHFSPDIVHIHGTEYPFGLSYLKAIGNKQVVVSIQGLVSIYERYYLGGIPKKELLKKKTLRDYIKNDTILKQKKDFYSRGKLERSVIRTVNHVI
ncbi:MAG: hypothetical protein ACYC25_13595, partial [Paludibacter sp.]